MSGKQTQTRQEIGRIGRAVVDAAMVRAATRRRRRAVLQQAHAAIRRVYRNPDLTLQDVAAAVGVSARQLQRVLREEGADDFRGHLLRVRMEKATELLTREDNPLSVRATAARVGYRNASGLRQAFVRFYGINPSTVQPDPPHYLGTLIEPPEPSE